MASDSIGTARVDIVIDLAQYELAIKRAKNAATGFGEDAEAAFDGQNSAAKRAARSLLTYVANLGKTREETMLLKAAGQGVDAEIIKAATDAINNYRAGVAATAAEQAKLNALHSEAQTWDTERTRQQSTGVNFDAEMRAAETARRRADATEALTLALMRQDAAEEALRNADRYAEEERAAQVAWRRADATEALTLALMREDAAEEAIKNADRYAEEERAAQVAWRRADATEALTLALMRQDAAEEALRNADRYAEEERAAQVAWRRADATEALTLALMREDAAEEAIKNAADQERDLAAAAAARRRADAVEVLTAELERQEAAERKLAADNNFIADLQRQEAQFGKTRAEILEMRAAEMGLSQQAAPFIASLKQKEAELGKYGTQLDASKRKLNEYGLSQKQLEFAMRGVPAQITDIFVSLQAGQAPLTVLLQQGGQLKDMFNGIRPAAQALTTQFLKMLTPVNVVAAATAALVVAAYQGAQEMSAFNRVAILTGNNMGVTGDQMAGMAAQMAAVTGSLKSTTAAAVEAAASAGKFTSEQLQLVATSALLLQREVGTAMDKTVAEFEKLAKKPVDAIVELNEKQHFLTAATYDHIRSLEEQGKSQEAATAAMQEYANVVAQRTEQVRDNIGLLESAWRNLGTGAKWAWEQMMDIGRDNSLSENIQKQGEKIVQTLGNIKAAQAQPGPGQSYTLNALAEQLKQQRAELSKLNRQAAEENRKESKDLATQTANETYITTQQLIDSQETKALKRKRERAKVEQDLDKGIAAAQLAGDIQLAQKIESQRAAALAAIDEKYKDPKKAKPSQKLENDTQRAALQAYKDQAEITNAAIEANSRTTQAAFQANTISAQAYYAQMRQNVTDELAANEKSLQGQIDYLKSAKDSINNRRQIGQLEADLAKARAKSASELAVLNEQEAASNKKNKQELEDFANALRASELAQQRNYAAQTAAIGQGALEAQRVAAVTQLYTEQADKLYQLSILKERNPGNAAQYVQEEAILRASTERQVEIVQTGFDNMATARGEWLNGFKRAFANYNDDMQNVAGQSEKFFTDVTSSIESVMTEFVKTGKLSFTDLTNVILQQLARLGTQRMLVGLISLFGGGASAGASMGTLANFGNNSGWTANAKGNVYPSASLSNYSGQVYNTPQTFAFAKGAGVFAEAGAEAIMPLTRTSDGKLGVQASGGAAATGDITLNVYGASGDVKATAKQTESGGFQIDAIVGQMESKMASNIMSGVSQVDTAMKKKYNLKVGA
jgi:lambda family phage tail tape measure protein